MHCPLSGYTFLELRMVDCKYDAILSQNILVYFLKAKTFYFNHMNDKNQELTSLNIIFYRPCTNFTITLKSFVVKEK